SLKRDSVCPIIVAPPARRRRWNGWKQNGLRGTPTTITPIGHVLTTAVDASGRNISASWKILLRPATGPGRLQFAPRCSSGDCRRPSGRKPRMLGSLGTLTAIVPNGGKDCPPVSTWQSPRSTERSALAASDPCGTGSPRPFCGDISQPLPSPLSSQRFWDHMDAVKPAAATAIWKDLVKDVVDRERIDLSSICYDGTNFYTFLDTFNTRCSLAARGKNKQGRDNLRQVSYALFCAADGQLPLFYDVYEGNRNDARQFALVLN